MVLPWMPADVVAPAGKGVAASIDLAHQTGIAVEGELLN